MQNYINMRVTQEQVEKEAQRKIAVIQSGYAFVVLQLIEMNKKRVSAMDTLVAKPTEKQGVYNFEIVSRQLMFEPDMNRGSVFTAYVLDTEWNRKFLASHYDKEYWEIVDVIPGRKTKPLVLNEFIEEIKVLRDELAEQALSSTSGMGIPVLTPQDKKPFDVASLDDEIIEQEMKRREALKKKDIGAMIPSGNKVITLDPDMSEEEFKKLSKGKRSHVTRLRKQREKEKIQEEAQEKEVKSYPESNLLTSPSGVQQP